MTHLKTLDGVKLVEADYETIGKMVTAAVLRENEKHIRSSQPDADGHVRLEGTLRFIMKLHADGGGARSVLRMCLSLGRIVRVHRQLLLRTPAQSGGGNHEPCQGDTGFFCLGLCVLAFRSPIASTCRVP